MEIKIITDGWARNSKVLINDKEVTELLEFNLSIRGGGKVKISMNKFNRETKTSMPVSHYGGDIEKFDVKCGDNPSLIGGEADKNENKV